MQGINKDDKKAYKALMEYQLSFKNPYATMDFPKIKDPLVEMGKLSYNKWYIDGYYVHNSSTGHSDTMYCQSYVERRVDGFEVTYYDKR